MLGIVVVLAAKLPNPAGLLLSAALATLGCSIWCAVAAATDSERSGNWELALGGVLCATALGLAGLVLVVLGAPVFR